MLIYGSSISPFVRKVMVFAAEKGIDVKVKGVGLGSTDPDYAEASPLRKMPALRDDDYLLSDSSAIVHYMEAKHPEPALIPAEARARGKAVWWDEFADTVLGAAAGKMFFNRIVAPRFAGRDGDLAAADAAERDELPPLIDLIEAALEGQDYLVGGALSLADIAVAAVLVNVRHAAPDFDLTRWPRTAAWASALWARPSFAAQLERDARILG